MSTNTGLIWGRREQGGKVKTKACPNYHVIDRLQLGAGTGQVHSAIDMNCVNINDRGLPNPGTQRVVLNYGQNKLGNSGVDQACPTGSYLSDAVIQHDNLGGNSANVQQIRLKCRNPDNQVTAEYLAGKNTGSNTNSVLCGPGGFYNKTLFTEGGTNITGIGFDCFDASNIINDDGWRRLNCCRTKTGVTDECGQYYRDSDACNTAAREFCTSGDNWMMPACVKWAEDHSTDMDSFYTTRCRSLSTPTDPITNGNFITFKFPNGEYLGNIEFGKPALAPFPMEYRIIDTGIRYDGEPVWEFHTVEDLPRYLQLYHYIDENANIDSSYQAVNRENFHNKNTAFEYGNPFRFMIRQMTPTETSEDGEETPATYWVEKYGTTISRDVEGGLQRYPVYMGFEGNHVILSEVPTYIQIENFNRGKVVCSCINAVDDLPDLLIENLDLVGAQAFCYSQDCVTKSAYKTEGQKREPCNQVLTICYANVEILNELAEQGVDIGNIRIDQTCGEGDGPSLGEPADERRMRIAFAVVVILLLAVLILK